MKRLPLLLSAAAPVLALFGATPRLAFAQDTLNTDGSTGTAPADQTALVAAPTKPADAPTFDAKPANTTTLNLSAGGQLATGNSRLLAMTGNGVFAMRRRQHGFGASLIGNYGQGASPGNDVVATAENAQGKVRYDYFFSDHFSVFGLVTGRHDRFQGLDFRLNLDPGVKYLLLNTPTLALWGELGYDYQYDIRRDSSREIFATDATGTTTETIYPKTKSDHAGRLYVGFHDEFNKEVALTTGIEYIQSVVDSTRYWLNYDALLTAGITGGLSFGFGLSLRYDHDPLPGKADLDTTTTLSLIYAFSSAPTTATASAPEVNPTPCDCGKTPPPPPDAPPPAAPASTTTPSNPAANAQPTTPPAVPPSAVPVTPTAVPAPPAPQGGTAPNSSTTTTTAPAGE